MYNFLFYLFSAIVVISALAAIFSGDKKFSRLMITIFLYSVSGIIILNNGGYISFLIIAVTSFAYFNKFISNYLNVKNIELHNEPIRIHHLLIISVLGAIISSLASSNMWQGELFLKNEITLTNLKIGLTGYYFVIFIVILVSLFLITII